MEATTLSSKIIIVTGGTRGLGWEMAEALIDAGHCVVITGRKPGPHLETLQGRLNHRAGSKRALALNNDVGQWADCERVVQQTLDAFGRVDGLINNAGLGMRAIQDNFLQDPPMFWQAEPQAFADIIQTNVVGPFFMARACVPLMVAQGYGRVVNVSTSQSTMVRRGYSPYGPSKAGLEALSVVWAKDLAGTGVTVNVLLPGGASATDMIPPNTPKDKLLPPQQMRSPIVWLMSDASSAHTGERYNAKEWPAHLMGEEAAIQARSAVQEVPRIM
ncbi:MAG: SDR family oxidoreductase [Betaproteobacteria bacterium]|nr:SDR family oxidoreductase [Betaproteobacteria bacterium]